MTDNVKFMSKILKQKRNRTKHSIEIDVAENYALMKKGERRRNPKSKRYFKFYETFDKANRLVEKEEKKQKHVRKSCKIYTNRM